MNLHEESLAPPTPFDLNFRLGDVPVRVHPYFWLSTLLLGWGSESQGIDRITRLLSWMVIVFVSVLVHEMGHILMGRYFGRRGHILLTGFCGLAIGSANLPERWQRNLVSFAGPLAGFLLAGVVTGVLWICNSESTLYVLSSLVHVMYIPRGELLPYWVMDIFYSILWLNIIWGLVNLLPVWPLDGGHICQETCQYFRPRTGERLAMQISLFTAAGFSILGLIEILNRKPLIPFLSLGGTWFSVIFFGILAYTSWQLLQQLRHSNNDWDRHDRESRSPWERDADWWK